MTQHPLQQKTFLLLLTLVTIAFGAILWPYYEAVFWGVALAILFMPLHRRMLLRMPGKPNRAHGSLHLQRCDQLAGAAAGPSGRAAS